MNFVNITSVGTEKFILSNTSLLSSKCHVLIPINLPSKLNNPPPDAPGLIATQINSLKVEQEKLQTAQGLALINKKRMDEIEDYLKSINSTTEFSDEMFTSLVDQVVVRNRYELEFQFKIGLKKTYKPE